MDLRKSKVSKATNKLMLLEKIEERNEEKLNQLVFKKKMRQSNFPMSLILSIDIQESRLIKYSQTRMTN